MSILKLEGLEPEININRPASAVDLSGLTPEPVNTPVIFVVGSPRSGTTAVGNVLGANSQCVNGDESLFLLGEWQKFDQLILGNNRRHSPYLSSFTTPQKALGYTAAYVDHFYHDLQASKPGAKYVVEHTPVYAHVFEFIDKMFPKAVYLHMVRDEAAVIASLRRVKETGGTWGQASDEARAAFRQHWVDVSRSIGEKAVGRYFEVAYEAFCTDPEGALAPLMGELGLSWEQAMTDAMKVRYAQN